jgi:hypothetical protein
MAKSRDKRGREDKKKKKPKKQRLAEIPAEVTFRHHSVPVTTEEPARPPEPAS